MRRVPPHPAAEAPLALVRDNRPHAGRLADDATGWLDTARGDIGDEAPHADAAYLLVVGQREMQRLPEPTPQQLGYQRQPDGAEALHVGHASPDERSSTSVANGSLSQGCPSTGTTSV